ncbi:MAG: DinB family protein [Longimicrobiales bacterium]
MTDWMLTEFDAEMAAARRVLERVPLEDPKWKPHPTSMEIGYLAFLVASMPGWATGALTRTELDIKPPPGKTWGDDAPATREGLLELFDRESAQARMALSEATEESLLVPWTLKMGDQPLMTQPRWMVYRRSAMNHLVHHRAQLGVYLRLLGVPVPSVYGPSADERSFGG